MTLQFPTKPEKSPLEQMTEAATTRNPARLAYLEAKLLRTQLKNLGRSFGDAGDRHVRELGAFAEDFDAIARHFAELHASLEKVEQVMEQRAADS